MLRKSVLGPVRFLSFVCIVAAASCGGGESEGGDAEGGEGGDGGESAEGGENGEGGDQGSSGGNTQAGGSGGTSNAKGGSGGATIVGGKGGTNAGGTGGGANVGGGGGGTGGAAAATPLEFYKAECASCHGEKGEGTKEGPEIQHPVRAFAKEVIRKGRTGHPDYADDMEAFSTAVLSDVNLNAIFDFLDSPPKPTTGKALYADFCQNCHGTKGDNGLAAHAVTTHIADIPRLVRAGHGGTSYLSRTSYMPAWTPAQLSDAELKLIADAVPTL